MFCLIINMFYSMFSLYLHGVFHSIRFKVNEDWLSRDNHFFVYMPLIILLKYWFYFSFEDYIVLRLFEFLLIGI